MDSERSHKLAYIAGFFDGEGYIGIQKTKYKHGDGQYRYFLEINLCQIDPRPLLRIIEEFGGRLYMVKPHPPSRPLYRWRAAAVKAADFLVEISPWLLNKREQAEIALSFQKTMLRSAGRKSVPTDVHEKRKELALAIKEERRIVIANSVDAFNNKNTGAYLQ